jgi:hypothetical protein
MDQEASMNGLLREIEDAENYLERFGDVLPAPALAKHQALLQELVDEHQHVAAHRSSAEPRCPVDRQRPAPAPGPTRDELLDIYRGAWKAFHRLGHPGMAQRVERKAAALQDAA